MIKTFLLLLLLTIISFIIFCLPSTAQAVYNVIDFGAQPDGTTDATASFLTTWANTCRSPTPAMFYVPKGTFLLGQAHFQGPCNNTQVTLHSEGTLTAYPVFATSIDDWIVFDQVENLSVYGGIVDGQGQNLWNCRATKGDSQCPTGTKASLLSLYGIFTFLPV